MTFHYHARTCTIVFIFTKNVDVHHHCEQLHTHLTFVADRMTLTKTIYFWRLTYICNWIKNQLNWFCWRINILNMFCFWTITTYFGATSSWCINWNHLFVKNSWTLNAPIVACSHKYLSQGATPRRYNNNYFHLSELPSWADHIYVANNEMIILCLILLCVVTGKWLIKSLKNVSRYLLGRMQLLV